MGLDVYLYRQPNREETRKQEEEYEPIARQVSKDLYAEMGVADFGGLPEEKTAEYFAERDKRLEPHRKRLNLDKYGGSNTCERIELPSKKHPDHYFKIGYWRSSYNEGGINSVLRRHIGKDIYDAVNPGDEDEFRPDWKKSMDALVDLMMEFKASIDELGGVDCFAVSAGRMHCVDSLAGAEDAESALKVFHEEQKKDCAFESYSSANGHFFKEPIEVLGIVAGEQYSRPCVYVVHKGNTFEFYLQALEIMIETCDWVLAQDDVENYYLSWSG